MSAHQSQLDQLDAEIAEMEGLFKNQQDEPNPEVVAPQGQPQVQQVDVVTSVEEFTGQGVADGSTSTEDAGQQTYEPEGSVTDAGRKSWKNEYNLLENRYIKLRQSSDHFKFETRQQIASLQESLIALQEQNDALLEKIAGYENNAGKFNLTSRFSPENVELFGEDTLQEFQKAMQETVESATQPLKTELLQMKKAERDRLKRQAQTNRSEAYTSFEAQLAQLVPDFRGQNNDKGFLAWLQETSPYSGVPRIQTLRNAEKIGDVERVAQFFVEYRQISQAPNDLLQQNVTPSGRGGSGTPLQQGVAHGQGADKKVFSMKFIDQFYNDDINGKYRGREALRDQLDKEIDLALQEGRVV